MSTSRRTANPRLVLALTTLAAGSLVLAAPAAAATETFDYTGSAQTWTVPADVTSATFDLYGAQGAGLTDQPSRFLPGFGGRATATISVIPGESIQLNAGGQGGFRVGGFNGGGSGEFGGGGASDVRIGGVALTDRVLVAGGGGGRGSGACNNLSVAGGDGGGANGGAGNAPPPGPCYFGQVAGGGGTQNEGGSATAPATPGAFGTGGDGGDNSGGGGGGWFGGGGGVATNFLGTAGGGGGSGYGPPATVFETGVRTGDGLITVTYTADRLPPPPDLPPVISGLRVVPKSFATGGKATPLERAKGAQIELTLSEDAKVRFRVRQNPERRNGGPPPKSPRSFTRKLSEGANSVPFSGKLGEAAFKPRRYKLIARARDSAGQRSERVEAGFRTTGTG